MPLCYGHIIYMSILSALVTPPLSWTLLRSRSRCLCCYIQYDVLLLVAAAACCAAACWLDDELTIIMNLSYSHLSSRHFLTRPEKEREEWLVVRIAPPRGVFARFWCWCSCCRVFAYAQYCCTLYSSTAVCVCVSGVLLLWFDHTAE